MNTSRAGSSFFWYFFHWARRRATSGRSCSLARRLFFEADPVAAEEAPERAAAGGDALLGSQGVNLVKRQIRLFFDEGEQGRGMVVELGPAPSRRLGGHAPRLAQPLEPFDG
jgi:hypothetical protein